MNLAPPVEEGGPRFRPDGPPAAESQLAELVQSLQVQLPTELQSLLLQMDGLRDVPGHLGLILSTQGILTTNRDMWDSPWPSPKPGKTSLKRLFFFGEAGNGDLYAFPIEDGEICADMVVEWNHEEDSLRRVATSLADFLRWWTITRQWS